MINNSVKTVDGIGWFIQGLAIFSLCSILHFMLFTSVPSEDLSPKLYSVYKTRVALLSPYTGLIYIGYFVVGGAIRRRQNWARITAMLFSGLSLTVYIALLIFLPAALSLRVAIMIAASAFIMFTLHRPLVRNEFREILAE